MGDTLGAPPLPLPGVPQPQGLPIAPTQQAEVHLTTGTDGQQYRLTAVEHNPFTAYHGAARQFQPEPEAPLGRFRNEMINSGEGTQGEGYGHYLSELKGVGKFYKQQATGYPGFREEGDLPQLYEVKVRAGKQQFLHLDAPISEQSPYIQKAIQSLPEEHRKRINDYVAKEARSTLEPPRAESVLDLHPELAGRLQAALTSGETVQSVLGSSRNESEIRDFLLSHGIKGIRYAIGKQRHALNASVSAARYDIRVAADIFSALGQKSSVLERRFTTDHNANTLAMLAEKLGYSPKPSDLTGAERHFEKLDDFHSFLKEHAQELRQAAIDLIHDSIAKIEDAKKAHLKHPSNYVVFDPNDLEITDVIHE